jgi:hypothetical protein
VQLTLKSLVTSASHSTPWPRRLPGVAVAFDRVDELAELRYRAGKGVIVGGDGEEGRQVTELERREARDAHLGGWVTRHRGRPRQYAMSVVAGWIQNTATAATP